MDDTGAALILETSTDSDGFVDIRVRAVASRPARLTYALEVTGGSTTRHGGSAQVGPGTHAPLSRVRIPAERNWCAILTYQDEVGDRHRQTAGPACTELPAENTK